MTHDTYPSEDQIRESLLARADAFRKLTGCSKTEIGKAAVNDPAFLHQVSKGRNFTISTYSRAMGWLDENWPEPRPASSEGRA